MLCILLTFRSFPSEKLGTHSTTFGILMLVESPSASLEEVVVWQGLSSIDDERSHIEQDSR